MSLLKFHKPAPRYTSYPTAPEWEAVSSEIYANKLKELSLLPHHPLSLYFHIPFCKTMCLYCGCSVVLNRKPENESQYVNYLMREIDLVTALLGQKRRVTQVHFGGGTPTKLSEKMLTTLFEKISNHFSLDFSKEIAMEIDPRTVLERGGAKLKLLKDLGFNRVSFGVQDTDPGVQEAVKRRQWWEMTQETYFLARKLGFANINLDLIYGLPLQTEATFSKTISDILSLRPERIALFSYAQVPWLKPHQKAIKPSHLPSPETKFAIYCNARNRLIDQGYVAIGMDHFALEDDEMAHSYKQKTLQRNFQGYTVRLAEDMLGFGMTSIGFTRQAYFQNEKSLKHYYAALDRDTLPVIRGKVLSNEDIMRKWVIHTLMCNFELDKVEFKQKFFLDFDETFSSSKSFLEEYEKEGLLKDTPDRLTISPKGELWIRIIVMVFDAYLKTEKEPKFSQSI